MTTAPMNPSHRQRGSVLVLVLAVTTIVGIIGLSSLLAVRLEHRDVQRRADAARAQLLADGVLQLVHARLGDDPDWRTHHTHATWAQDERLGNGSQFSYQLRDEGDENLADDANETCRLVIRLAHDGTVRLISQEFIGVSPNPARGSYRRELNSR